MACEDRGARGLNLIGVATGKGAPQVPPLRFAPVGMTKCRGASYLQIRESDRKISQTDFFRSL